MGAHLEPGPVGGERVGARGPVPGVAGRVVEGDLETPLLGVDLGLGDAASRKLHAIRETELPDASLQMVGVARVDVVRTTNQSVDRGVISQVRHGVDQMLEPVVMGREGVLRMGTLMLRKIRSGNLTQPLLYAVKLCITDVTYET